jgi:hypothetical protein
MARAITFRHFAAAALLCCLAPGTTSAQSSASQSQAAAFLRSSVNRNAVQDAAIRYSRRLPGGCTDVRFDPQFTVLAFAPLQFSADGKTLAGGIWKEQLRAIASALRVFSTFCRPRAATARSCAPHCSSARRGPIRCCNAMPPFKPQWLPVFRVLQTARKYPLSTRLSSITQDPRRSKDRPAGTCGHGKKNGPHMCAARKSSWC